MANIMAAFVVLKMRIDYKFFAINNLGVNIFSNLVIKLEERHILFIDNYLTVLIG